MERIKYITHINSVGFSKSTEFSLKILKEISKLRFITNS